MIIFINHMPANPWFDYTPSRLGPSDAAEIFVFLSGFASAIAFGRSFQQAGLGLGSVRVLFRCLQLYAAHLALFIMMATLLLFMNTLGFVNGDWHLDNLDYFFNDTRAAVLALVSLKFVPNFIDILPMYLVILLWLPLVWALSRLHVALALGFSVSLYGAAWHFGWELTANPMTGNTWYFNPFCWQLIFFTGFAFRSGWLPIPGYHRGLLGLCLVFAVFCFPLENPLGYENLPWFTRFREEQIAWIDKSHLGVLRYLHFLALSYLVITFLRRRQHWLQTGLARTIIVMGQQSLPVFMISTCLSFLGGMLMNTPQPSLLESAWVNIAGLGLMMLLAELLNWLDRKPWKTVPANAVNINPNWPRQAALAFSLLAISALPLAFLHTAAPVAEMAAENQAPDQIVTLQNDLAPVTEEVTFRPQEPELETPDPL